MTDEEALSNARHDPDVRLPPREYVKAVFGDAEWELNPGSDDDG